MSPRLCFAHMQWIDALPPPTSQKGECASETTSAVARRRCRGETLRKNALHQPNQPTNTKQKPSVTRWGEHEGGSSHRWAASCFL